MKLLEKIPFVGSWWATRPVLITTLIVATVATLWSLYLSLGLGLIPCELCWYQRILMYPLVVILGVGVYENRAGVYRTTLPLSFLGIVVASYHSYIQIISSGSGNCTIGTTSCATVQYRFLGLTTPNLSLIAFVIITGGLLIIYTKNKGSIISGIT